MPKNTWEDAATLPSFSGGNVPFSYEAEQSVLGAILLDASCINTVMEILPRAEYFYQVNNVKIYEVMLEMFTTGKAIDYVTVLDRLKEDPDFDESSGKVYLMQLVEAVPSISNVESYARIVRDKYDVRMLILTSKSILDDATEGAGDAAALLDAAEQRIFDIRQGKNVQGLQRLNEVILQTFDRLDKLNSPDADQYRGIPTNIKELDDTITGLNRTDLIILGARPGMGKTSFALNLARNAAVNSGKRIAFFSLEMSKEQLASRLLSSEAMINGTSLRTGELSESDWARLIEAGDLLSKTEIYLDDSPGITVPEMKAKVRRLKHVDAIFIDYLQLMTGTIRTDNRVQEISEITRNLKIMAKELAVPVVTLAQLARGSEKRNDHRPVLSDLRDSGSIEQDADIVLFLYRDDYYAGEGEQKNENADKNSAECIVAKNENADKNSAECIVAKNRHGEAKTIPLHWQGEFMRFTAKEFVRQEM